MLLGAKIKFYVLRVVVWLPNMSVNMPDSETNLLKFELGISNNSGSLLYLPLISGDNNFICRSSARQMPWK
jgi:hypothetical protein